jgi:hypothetical protein
MVDHGIFYSFRKRVYFELGLLGVYVSQIFGDMV